MKEHKIFIAVGKTDEYRDVLLTHHVGSSRHDVEVSIMDKAREEGFKGNLNERLEELNWDIGEFKLTRIIAS
ncbi:MAG: hypothetical protein WC762_03200 [Methylobacter sp.]|jgi:hypothetical protein